MVHKHLRLRLAAEGPCVTVRSWDSAVPQPKTGAVLYARPGLLATFAQTLYGSVNTWSAVPRGAPNISGAKPSTHPPHPVGTATYCLPPTL